MTGTTTPTVKIVGIVDKNGYLFCADCADVTDSDRDFIWSDSPPHSEETCDFCGEVLNRQAHPSQLRERSSLRSKLAAAVLAVTAFVAAGQLDHRGPADRGQAAIVKCAEDDPCWNCKTMGNHICGPATAKARPSR